MNVEWIKIEIMIKYIVRVLFVMSAMFVNCINYSLYTETENIDCSFDCGNCGNNREIMKFSSNTVELTEC